MTTIGTGNDGKITARLAHFGHRKCKKETKAKMTQFGRFYREFEDFTGAEWK
jgi:hypothetical protein